MPKKKAPLSRVERRVLAERNLESWPLFVPADSRAKPVVRIFSGTVRQEDSSFAEASVTIEFSPVLGALTTEDEKVLYCLYDIWREQKEPDVFEFTLRGLARHLGRDESGRHLREIARSLRRLRTVAITWQQAFQMGGGKISQITRPITILNHLVLAQVEEGKRVTLERCKASFDENLRTNLRQFVIRPVRLDVVLKLRSGVAQLVYRYVDPLLHAAPRVIRPSAALFAAVGLDAKKYRYPSERRLTLERALPEIQGAALSTEACTLVWKIGETDGEDFPVIFERRGQPAGRIKRLEPTAEEPTAPIAMRPSTKALAPAADPAADLTLHFHRVFFDVEPTKLGARELARARDLLERAGDLETARAVVEWARAEAHRTNFRVASFGGITQYVERALGDLRGRAAELEAEARREEGAKACGICGGAGHLAARWPGGRLETVPCPHDRARLEGWMAEKGFAVERAATD